MVMAMAMAMAAAIITVTGLIIRADISAVVKFSIVIHIEINFVCVFSLFGC